VDYNTSLTECRKEAVKHTLSRPARMAAADDGQSGHTGDKPFACHLCDYKATRKGHLTVHIRRHTGDKPFACHLCDYKATRKGHLTVHIRRHTGDKPFACHLCDYKATRKGHLTVHIRRHTGDKPFACHLCDYKATRRSALVHHGRRHHPGAPPPRTCRSGPSTAGGAAAPPAEPSECIICMDGETAFTCIPCGHQCVCGAEGCKAAIERTERCPMCDQAVSELMAAHAAEAALRTMGRRVYHI